MSEYHYHLIIRDLPEEYTEKYPDFTRLITNNTGHISVNFTEPHTISLCGVSCDNYDGKVSLEDVVEFLITQVAGRAYGHPAPETIEFLQYCELKEKPDCEDHLRIRQQQTSQA
jgi:hypothetical protein